MTIPLKDGTNAQWGRTASDGGDLVPSSQEIAGDNGGKAPLLDAFGRPWVRVVNEVPQVATLNDATSPLLISASPATLLHVAGTAGGNTYLQLFDTSVVPVNGDIPAYSIEAMNNAFVSLSLLDLGDPFATGLAVAWSKDMDVYDSAISGTPTEYRTRVLWR